MNLKKVKRMKKYFYYLCMGLAGMLFLNSCDDDDDDIRLSDVPQAVVSAFEAKYPNVSTNIEWEKNRGYYVADFWYENSIKDAWFDSKGTWRMTETDLGTNMSALPEAVQTAFTNSQYNTWRVDDIDKYERPADTFYLLEIETKGKSDRNLYFAPDGTVLKDAIDRDGDDVTPDTAF